MRRLWLAMPILLLVVMLSFSGGCARERLIVVEQRDEVSFVKQGATFLNSTEMELVVISKDNYLRMLRAVDAVLDAEAKPPDGE